MSNRPTVRFLDFSTNEVLWTTTGYVPGSDVIVTGADGINPHTIRHTEYDAVRDVVTVWISPKRT